LISEKRQENKLIAYGEAAMLVIDGESL